MTVQTFLLARFWSAGMSYTKYILGHKMSKVNKIQLFEKQSVRTHCDEEKELWYFSIIDVVAILTEQNNYQGARNYWKVLKHCLLREGNETVTNCNRLKMKATDGKMRITDVADTEQLLRLIQSIPSP